MSIRPTLPCSTSLTPHIDIADECRAAKSAEGKPQPVASIEVRAIRTSFPVPLRPSLHPIPAKTLAIDLLTAKAQELDALSRIPEATECYDAAILLDPSSLILVVQRGEHHAKTGDFRAALEDFDSVLVEQPCNWRAWFGQGEIYRLLGSLDEGQRALEKAIYWARDESELEQPMYALALLHWRRGDMEAAIKAVSQAIETRPERPLGWALRAAIRDLTGIKDDAKADYEVADRLVANPPPPKAWVFIDPEDALSFAALMQGNIQPTYRLCHIK